MLAREGLLSDSLEALIGEMVDTPLAIPPGIAACPFEQARVASKTFAEATGEEFRGYTFELPENPPLPEDIIALLNVEELSDDELSSWAMAVWPSSL